MDLPRCILCQRDLRHDEPVTVMPLPLVMDRHPVPVFACGSCKLVYGDDLSFRLRAAAAASLAGLFDATVPISTTPAEYFSRREATHLPPKPYIRVCR